MASDWRALTIYRATTTVYMYHTARALCGWKESPCVFSCKAAGAALSCECCTPSAATGSSGSWPAAAGAGPSRPQPAARLLPPAAAAAAPAAQPAPAQPGHAAAQVADGSPGRRPRRPEATGTRRPATPEARDPRLRSRHPPPAAARLGAGRRVLPAGWEGGCPQAG